jgi:hypothetical protein
MANKLAAIERVQPLHNGENELGIVLEVPLDRFSHEIACAAAVARSEFSQHCLFLSSQLHLPVAKLAASVEWSSSDPGSLVRDIARRIWEKDRRDRRRRPRPAAHRRRIAAPK